MQEQSLAWGGFCWHWMTEKGGVKQKSEVAGQEWQVAEPRVGAEMEEVEVVWIWS